MRRVIALASLVMLGLPGTAHAVPLTSPAPTSLTIILSTAIEKLQVGGDLDPDHFGDTVTLTQFKRRNGAWRQIAEKVVEMEDFGTAGDFVTTFELKKSGRCKMRAFFPGDDDHLPATATRRYRCSGDGLEGPARG